MPKNPPEKNPKKTPMWWPIWSERKRLLPWEAYPLRPDAFEPYKNWPEADVLLAYRRAANPLSVSRHTFLLLRKVRGGLRLEVAHAFFGYSSPGAGWKLLQEADSSECIRGIWRSKRRGVVFQTATPSNKPRSSQLPQRQTRQQKEFA